jgi:hypothetical protein
MRHFTTSQVICQLYPVSISACISYWFLPGMYAVSLSVLDYRPTALLLAASMPDSVRDRHLAEACLDSASAIRLMNRMSISAYIHEGR